MRMIWTAAIASALAACGGDRPAAATGESAEASPATPATTTAAAGRSERRVFSDWKAVCDNGGRCTTYSGTGTGGWLAIRLDAGPDARPEIVMDLSAISGVPIRLVIDGRSQDLTAPADDQVGFRVPATEVPATLARLAAARE
ncbi:DUF1176 domain-containing protein, partial [Brevundimonas sp.]|uniref:DUF1176 domain-containing protein n=1 Tax=Brevundimonas sp. TaxID=1871086 RepID=UPI002FC887DB